VANQDNEGSSGDWLGNHLGSAVPAVGKLALYMSRKEMHRMTDYDYRFCAECSFEGSQDDVKEHARQFQHKYGISGEYLFTADFEGTISMGVTGCPAPKGMDPNLWIYANFCYRPGCGAAVKDNEVKDHIRSHVAKGE
jgi:hypothetical protein